MGAFFGSYVIQGWHTKGRYTQYAHVDWVNPKIPFHPPEAAKDEAGKKTGDLKYSLALRTPVKEFRDPKVAVFLKAGEIIGESGMTGCGWGKRCYDFAVFDKTGRPDFREADYKFAYSPHLHFMVFGRRAPRSRTPKIWDSFGIYGEASDGYPKRQSQWQKRLPQAKHQPLWSNYL